MSDTHYDVATDLGDLGCGDLIIALMKAIHPLQAGQVLLVRALDPGAQEDIPAWCRMRGHTLLAGPNSQDPEHYYIRKGESNHG
jgi:tRNA 2-thiouridine synthesizing protein A